MALLTAYARLQLDPEHHSRVAAFEALCWQHIFKHASREWAISCWEGSIKLQLWTSKTSSTQGFKSYDSTLNHLVSEFVHAYATAIWPADDAKRSHLALVDKKYPGMELKALQWQLSVGQSTKQRFKATQDLDLTARDAMVESKIGQRVRTYLMNLLLFKQPVPNKDPADAGDLLQMFLNPPIHKRAHSKPVFATGIGAAPVNELHVSSKRSKKEQKPLQLRHGNTFRERSTGLVRLRFTISGAKRLRRIISRYPQPAAGLTRSSNTPNKTKGFVSTSSAPRNSQLNTATNAYQCWLRSCGEVFRTTQEVVLHVKQKHMIECRGLTTIPTVSVAVMYSPSQHLPTVPGYTMQVEHTNIESSEAREAAEQDSAIGANVLLQSLQNAEKAGFTFDDEYVAMIHRYARG
jgi:hypothetical protein